MPYLFLVMAYSVMEEKEEKEWNPKKNNVEKAERRLKNKGIMDENRKVLPAKVKNCEYSPITGQIYYNSELFAQMDVKACIFILAHEEGHSKQGICRNLTRPFHIRKDELDADEFAAIQLKNHGSSSEEICTGAEIAFDEIENKLPSIKWWQFIRQIKKKYYPTNEERLERIKKILALYNPNNARESIINASDMQRITGKNGSHN